jgi:hypothetical protein
MWRIQHPFRKAESGIGLDVNFAVELLVGQDCRRGTP